MEHDRGVFLPALGTIVFVLLVPGTVVVAVPYLLTRWLGAALLACALPLFVAFNLRFVVEGRGTPAPVAPTQRLVMGGPFRWVRNPGYVAVVALLVGQALVFGSTLLLAYAGAVAACFHLFIVLYEEPTLRKQFGAEYEAYSQQVPRWVPRWARRG